MRNTLDISWCVILSFMRRHTSYIVKSITQRTSIDWFFSGTDKPECVRHMLLDDDSRRVGFALNGQHKCDGDLAEGWYRFLNNKRLSDQCAEIHSCSTDYPGWLVGAHPSVSAGRVTRKVCFGRKSSSSCPCTYHTYITVRNCGSFHVYKLKPTPKCNLRYCTN